MTPWTPPPDPDGKDCRYLSLVRELGAATQAGCDPLCVTHRQDAAWHINALINNPELLWKLLVVAAQFEKQPPPGLDDLKRRFSARAARQASQSDGSTEKQSSDGS